MSSFAPRPAPIGAALLFALLLWWPLAGCGGDPESADEATVGTTAAPDEAAQAELRPALPETRAEARAALQAAREGVARESARVEGASAEVEGLRSELEAAEGRLQSARGALDGERRRLADAEEQMLRFAVPDPQLFRDVQRQLLDSAALRDVAIAAEVEKGVVTLRGRVPDEAARATAVELAGEVDGVISVDDRIEVAGASE